MFFDWKVDKLQTMMWDFVGWLMNNKEVLNSPEAKKIEEEASLERHSIFWEVVESISSRYTPGMSKLFDMFSSVGIREWDPEVIAWQNEFEGITGWTLVCPDKYLKPAGDFVLNLPGFIPFVKWWPFGGPVKAKLLAALDKDPKNVDPDLVVNMVRTMHQDTFSLLWTWIKKIIGK